MLTIGGCRAYASGGSVAIHGALLAGFLTASYVSVEPLAGPSRGSPPELRVVLPPAPAGPPAGGPPPGPAARADHGRKAGPENAPSVARRAESEEILADEPRSGEAPEGVGPGGGQGGIPGGGPGGSGWFPGGLPVGAGGGGGFQGVLDGLPGAKQPLSLIGDIRPPERTVFVKPEYPMMARLARTGGKVILEIVVGLKGDVEEVRILKPDPLFEQAAIEAVKQWRYRPALQHGRPVRVYMTVVVEFSLR